jgi:GMP synthase-like glutamine amidotransferase
MAIKNVKVKEKLKVDNSIIIGVDRGFNISYESFLNRLSIKNAKFMSFTEILEHNEKETMLFPDLLLFTGGADVDPGYYNDRKGANTHINKERDVEEAKIFEKYYGTPKIGICRGAQFLTAFSGGKLVQDVNGHLGNHIITTNVKSGIINYGKLYVTSTHHQMMFPYNLPKGTFELIGWSTKHLSDKYLNGNNENIELPSDFLEPEIVYYKNTRALAIQGHPEFDKAPDTFVNLTLNLIKNYLL